jgi:hypothetical protein
MAIFTALLFALNGVTVVILRNQLKEMHEGGIDTHALAQAASDQADAAQQFSDTAEDINGDINGAVDQLQAAADNAKVSIQATQTAMRLEQRAWVSILYADLTKEPAVTEPLNITFRLTNTGRTPAKNLTTKGATYIWNGVPPPVQDWTKIKSVGTGILFPNSTTGEMKGGPPLDNITQPSLDAYHNHASDIYVRIRLDYDDVFGCHHWTQICGKHSFGSNHDSFELCEPPGENDIDTQECGTKHHQLN